MTVVEHSQKKRRSLGRRNSEQQVERTITSKFEGHDLVVVFSTLNEYGENIRVVVNAEFKVKKPDTSRITQLFWARQITFFGCPTIGLEELKGMTSEDESLSDPLCATLEIAVHKDNPTRSEEPLLTHFPMPTIATSGN